MTFPPSAFIIGAQRSGTTSLASLLSQHPDIMMSNPKEPDFLSVNWDRGLEWYRSCFKREDRILVDASVNYTMQPVRQGMRYKVVARRAFELSPQARFVYIVRDPAERCYSAYWHDVRSGREGRSLKQAVAEGAYYTHASFYYAQLLNFLEYFPLERFLIVPFKNFVRDPTACASQCASFFGAEDGFIFKSETAKNESFLYNGFGHIILNVLGERVLKTSSHFAQRHIPLVFHTGLKKIFYNQIPPMSEADRIWLTERFRADAMAFQHLTGIAFSGETTPHGARPYASPSE